jgi:predicted nucleic acid-binding protein
VIAYFDTSAAIKLVILEDGSAEAARLWTEATRVASSILLYPEGRAALAQARRDRRLGPSQLKVAVTEFESLWSDIDRVGAGLDVATRAGALAAQEALRGYDAVHLASAETIFDPELVLVAADRGLCDAAQRLGFAVARLGHL